jgi:S1-C subfamily serine protease
MSSLRPLVFAAVGGLVVAGAFLALGVTGRRTTQTVVQEAPMAAQPVSSSSRRLTPHALYERDAPGVVYVSADARKPVQDPFAVRAAHSKGVSTGSGFLVGRSGKILTTYDVVDGADRDDGVAVSFGDGASVPAAVVASDPGADIALLRVSARDLPHVPPLPLGDSTTVRVGDPAAAA